MNDYARGALEALSYVESLMTQLDRSNSDNSWSMRSTVVCGVRWIVCGRWDLTASPAHPCFL